MKKHLLFVGAILISMTSWAQAKGERYIAGSINAECGTQTTTMKFIDSYAETITQPQNAAFGVGIEYATFVSDNWRLALAASVGWSSTPQTKYDWGWAKNRSIEVDLNPNVAYYVQLADRLYYTPEVGVIIGYGSLSEQASKTTAYKDPFWGWGVYAHLLALEFRATEKFAIGTAIGTIRYTGSVIPYYDLSVSMFKFDLGQSSVNLRFYF